MRLLMGFIGIAYACAKFPNDNNIEMSCYLAAMAVGVSDFPLPKKRKKIAQKLPLYIA